MNYWIFTIKTHIFEGKTYTAEDIYNTRMDDTFWAVKKNHTQRKRPSTGDEVVFYFGKPEEVFVGTAVLKSQFKESVKSEKEKYGHGNPFYTPDGGFELGDIDRWQKRKPIEEMIGRLHFIKNKQEFWVHLQGGITEILVKDFEIITQEGIERAKNITYRVKRDANLSNKIKLLYQNKCQICGESIKLKTDSYYSEVHHLQPLGGEHKGRDSEENMIVVCPNHHVEFDYGVIAINPETMESTHKDSNNHFNNKRVIINPKHKLSPKFLKYHIEKIFND